MKIHLKFFAIYRERLGGDERTIEAPEGQTVGECFQRIAEEIGAKSDLNRSTLFAVNHEYVRANTPLKDGDEVAFIPPVAGGSR